MPLIYIKVNSISDDAIVRRENSILNNTKTRIKINLFFSIIFFKNSRFIIEKKIKITSFDIIILKIILKVTIVKF